ncbi:MAG: hypothetical protein OEZ34_02300 [Spirochaetia bacterium]|nr:hypothetical protein [Spirochaetia bacterium]
MAESKKTDQKSRITPAVKKKLDRFLKSSIMQEKYLREVLEADPAEILWPEMNPRRFGRQFVTRMGGKSVAFPLLLDQIKIQSLEYRIKAAQKGYGEIINPSIAYYYIYKFENEVLKLKKSPVGKKKAAKTGKAAKKSTPGKKAGEAKDQIYFTEEEENKNDILDRLSKIKRKLKVPAALKRQKDEKKLLDLVLAEQRKITDLYAKLSKRMEASQVQISFYKNPDFMHKVHRKKMEQMESDLAEYESLVRHEASRADLLEREVGRLTEQLISLPMGGYREDMEELENIKKEFSILSQKYDTLVSKNIDLTNRLDRENATKSLESLLDAVRDKINRILKSGIAGTSEGDQAILSGLKPEITQLTRARMYLGKALYDLGILYLRAGEKDTAVNELRAAKELGVEDPETNKIINPS